MSEHRAGWPERYDKHPTFRALLQLVPLGVGSAVDTFLAEKVAQIRDNRLREFFDELAAGEHRLTLELIESEEFLHCYFATLRAALNTNREEKIRAFARLLKSSTTPGAFSGIDDFEAYRQILDELSYRELVALSLLERYEQKAGVPGKKEPAGATGSFWQDFLKEIAAVWGVGIEEARFLLARMARTGLYYVYEGLWNGNPDLMGRLTEPYFRLKRLVGDISPLDPVAEPSS